MKSALATCLAAALLAAPAAAQDVQVPRGYKFCGWRDYVSGGWTYEDPGPGAFTRLFARKMSCRTARRKFRRVHYVADPPYEPQLKGYRCVHLKRSYEYVDDRCTRRGRPKIALRWQAGS